MKGPAAAGKALPGRLQLGPADLHVWRASLALAPAAAERLAPLLTPEERDRSERRRSVELRVQAVASRALVRLLLGRYTGLDARGVRLEQAPHGKPEMRRRRGVPSIEFNLSHSAGVALVGLTTAGPVGVDLERVRPEFDWLRLAGRFFAGPEVAWLRRQPAASASEAFFRLWTCKEAVAKAMGRGLGLPFSGFVVGPGEGDRLRLASLGDSPADTAAWQLIEIDAGAGFVGAAAIWGREGRAPECALRCMEWRWED